MIRRAAASADPEASAPTMAWAGGEAPGDALVARLDRLVQGTVQRELARRAPRESKLDRVTSFALAAGSIMVGFPISFVTVAFVHGPVVLAALGIEWAAITAINLSHSWGPRRVRVGFPSSVLHRAAVPQGPAPPAPGVPPRSDPLAALPLGVQVKAEQVRRKAEMLLRHQDRFPIGSRDLFVLRRTRAEYLPATLDAYLALSGDDRPLAPDGRNGLQVLRDQLDLLDRKLDEITDDLQRENRDRLLANERFLEEHFGRAPIADNRPR